MEFERERKINRLLLQSLRAYEKFKDPYLKVPVELAEFAVKERRISEASTYLAGLFLYSGKAKSVARPTKEISSICRISERTVYRSFNWLADRDWLLDPNNGWYFFRGMNRVHEMEGWKYTRCAVIQEKDLSEAKAFFIGTVLSNIARTGRGTGTDRTSKRSGQPRFPISLSMIQKVFGVSKKTAFTYRKLAKNAGYIKTTLNTPQVTGLSAKDVRLMKVNDIEHVEISLLGFPDSIHVHPNQLFSNKGKVYAQLANFVYPKVLIKKRKLSQNS